MSTFLKMSRGALCFLVAGLAQPVPAIAAPTIRDGAPTPAACEALGFKPPLREDERRVGGFWRRSAKAYAPMALATPPPPPPPPAMAPPVPGAAYMTAPAYPAPPSDQGLDTERYPHAAVQGVRRTADAPVSTFSVDVDTAAYANVRRFLNDGQAPPRDAVRTEELINYFDYRYARPTDPAKPFQPFVAVAPSPWSPGHQLIQIGLQGYDIPRAERPPLNLVFLIDTSGSMSDEAKLPLARKALNLLIDQLRPGDRVAMVAYAGSAGAVLAPTDGTQKLKMRCALTALEAGGSTAGGAGLDLAYALAQQNFDPKAVNRVILMTDGDFNVGVADPARLTDVVADKRKTGVYLSVYGFGQGNYNDTLMQALAQNGNGTAGYVDTLAEARRAFRDDFSGSLFPIADDAKIQVEFNPATVSEYRLIGYETRLLSREDFNNDQVDAGEVGSGVSVTALYEITPVGQPGASDPLRYGAPAPPPAKAGELAYLKVRYKLPGQATSQLMERPIGARDVVGELSKAPEPVRFAVAVAAFGQKLRGDPWMSPAFTWDRIADLAQGARGDDPFGQRAEFVQLVRAARDTAR